MLKQAHSGRLITIKGPRCARNPHPLPGVCRLCLNPCHRRQSPAGIKGPSRLPVPVWSSKPATRAAREEGGVCRPPGGAVATNMHSAKVATSECCAKLQILHTNCLLKSKFFILKLICLPLKQKYHLISFTHTD